MPSQKQFAGSSDPLKSKISSLKLDMIAPTELLWALIGLLLTIGGTFLEAFIAAPVWSSQQGFAIHSLKVTYQIGAVLLVGCAGGKNAGALSQIAYLFLGLTWFPVFAQGGGMSYLKEPSFGYLLGFIPGSWLCGFLAFKMPPRIESLALSCLCGLLCIHLTGLTYLAISYAGGWLDTESSPLWSTALKYSVYPLPGQFAVACAATVLAFALRRFTLS